MLNRTGRLVVLLTCAVAVSGPSHAQQTQASPGSLLVHESFEDTAFASRGWCDGAPVIIEDPTAPDGSRVALWHWFQTGAISPDGGGGRLRLPALDDVTIGYRLRLSDDWTWTGRGYHPHSFSLLTNLDPEYVGPAFTHLTTYAEVVDGIPRLALRDGRNVDPDHVDPTEPMWSEDAAVAGCNGDTDGHGLGDCYRSGENWFNGKIWRADRVLLPSPTAPNQVPAWHEIRARFRLNSVADGVTHRDGVLQMWFDRELIIDVQDAVLRSARHPHMLFNQLFVGPYYGPGVPHPQSM
ncbi:MAG: hypothetical protein CME13_15940 [Gemmatimonadetes bacterium]|jgi:hypothetical protein|nr:hypothetical protein [Gemmatimonadota bacterium]|tara:strand:- start:1559 stop:2443 length:885 start_codon:yes stop_codon:yes gene_type:complete